MYVCPLHGADDTFSVALYPASKVVACLSAVFADSLPTGFEDNRCHPFHDFGYHLQWKRLKNDVFGMQNNYHFQEI